MVLVQILLSCVYLFVCNAIVRGNKFMRYLMLFIVGWYSLQLVFAVADPYKVYSIKPITIIVFNFQIVFLLLGVCAFVNKHINNNIQYSNKAIFKINTNTVLLVVNTIFLLYTYYNFSRMRVYLMSLEGITQSSRNYYFSEFFGSYKDVLINEIIRAYSIVSYFILFGISFFHTKKHTWADYYLILSSLAAIVLTSLTTMGRFEMMELLVAFIFFYFYSRSIRDNRIKKRVAIFGGAMLIMMVLMIFSVTMFRHNLMVDSFDSLGTMTESLSELVVEPFVTYFYVPILAFDYGTEYLFNNLGPFFGGANLAGFIDFLLIPITFLFNDFPTLNNTIGSVMTQPFWFPAGKMWNALFTGASNYYLDFGYYGFILFSFVQGYFLGILSVKAKQRASWFIVLLFFFIAGYKSAFSSNTQSISMVFTFLWILLLKSAKSIS